MHVCILMCPYPLSRVYLLGEMEGGRGRSRNNSFSPQFPSVPDRSLTVLVAMISTESVVTEYLQSFHGNQDVVSYTSPIQIKFKIEYVRVKVLKMLI